MGKWRYSPTVLTSALDGGVCSSSHSSCFTPKESPHYPLDRKLGRAQSWSGCSGEKKSGREGGRKEGNVRPCIMSNTVVLKCK